MTTFFFTSDLHGKKSRYTALFQAIRDERPDGVFLGGDLLPSGWTDLSNGEDFLFDFLVPSLEKLRAEMKDRYPSFGVILGNDDPRVEEHRFQQVASQGLWRYLHGTKELWGDYPVFGYSFVPPSPFLLKDWERYDVSRFVDPGCVSPEKGRRSVPLSPMEARHSTIQKDLENLVGKESVSEAIFLFHSPPYSTSLDRAALDGKKVDHVPLDVHVGSIAIKRFIETHQPRVTLHGHIHESSRITGSFKEKAGDSVMIGGAHDGPELSLVSFDPDSPWSTARRRLL